LNNSSQHREEEETLSNNKQKQKQNENNSCDGCWHPSLFLGAKNRYWATKTILSFFLSRHTVLPAATLILQTTTMSAAAASSSAAAATADSDTGTLAYSRAKRLVSQVSYAESDAEDDKAGNSEGEENDSDAEDDQPAAAAVAAAASRPKSKAKKQKHDNTNKEVSKKKKKKKQTSKAAEVKAAEVKAVMKRRVPPPPPLNVVEMLERTDTSDTYRMPIAILALQDVNALDINQTSGLTGNTFLQALCIVSASVSSGTNLGRDANNKFKNLWPVVLRDADWTHTNALGESLLSTIFDPSIYKFGRNGSSTFTNELLSCCEKQPGGGGFLGAMNALSLDKQQQVITGVCRLISTEVFNPLVFFRLARGLAVETVKEVQVAKHKDKNGNTVRQKVVKKKVLDHSRLIHLLSLPIIIDKKKKKATNDVDRKVASRFFKGKPENKKKKNSESSDSSDDDDDYNDDDDAMGDKSDGNTSSNDDDDDDDDIQNTSLHVLFHASSFSWNRNHAIHLIHIASVLLKKNHMSLLASLPIHTYNRAGETPFSLLTKGISKELSESIDHAWLTANQPAIREHLQVWLDRDVTSVISECLVGLAENSKAGLAAAAAKAAANLEALERHSGVSAAASGYA
jgi:hypothetical protein